MFVAWWGSVGLYLALLVLIIAGFVMLGGRGVVMGSPLGLRRVPLELSWMSSSVISGCLLVHFPSGNVLLRLLTGPHTWRLPVFGHAVDLVAAAAGVVQEAPADGDCQEVHWVSGWKRLRHVGHSSISILDHKSLIRSGLGWSNSLGLCRPTSPGLHAFQRVRSFLHS